MSQLFASGGQSIGASASAPGAWDLKLNLCLSLGPGPYWSFNLFQPHFPHVYNDTCFIEMLCR